MRESAGGIVLRCNPQRGRMAQGQQRDALRHASCAAPQMALTSNSSATVELRRSNAKSVSSATMNLFATDPV
jgi:hypothetical protein